MSYFIFVLFAVVYQQQNQHWSHQFILYSYYLSFFLEWFDKFSDFEILFMILKIILWFWNIFHDFEIYFVVLIILSSEIYFVILKYIFWFWNIFRDSEIYFVMALIGHHTNDHRGIKVNFLHIWNIFLLNYHNNNDQRGVF